jgi:hypothetical protein
LPAVSFPANQAHLAVAIINAAGGASPLAATGPVGVAHLTHGGGASKTGTVTTSVGAGASTSGPPSGGSAPPASLTQHSGTGDQFAQNFDVTGDNSAAALAASPAGYTPFDTLAAEAAASGMTLQQQASADAALQAQPQSYSGDGSGGGGVGYASAPDDGSQSAGPTAAPAPSFVDSIPVWGWGLAAGVLALVLLKKR